jgi:hypothetical protein
VLSWRGNRYTNRHTNSAGDRGGLLQEHGGNTTVTHFRLYVNGSDPRGVLLSMYAVILNHATAIYWCTVGERYNGERNAIFPGMRPKPAEYDFGSVMPLAPPLLINPSTHSSETLRALGQLLNLEFHSETCTPNQTQVSDDGGEGVR